MTDVTWSNLQSLHRMDGKVAIVTGASSGLGARFAAVLSAAGATVFAAARRVDRLEKLAEQSSGIQPIAFDASREPERRRLVDEVLNRAGRIDVLVNNAAASGGSVEAENESLDDIQRVIELNVVAALHMAQLAARSMFESGGGCIINVASILGLVAGAPLAQASYVASKGAIVSLTRELAVQWARKGVRVNALAPGWVRTEMTQALFDSERPTAYVQRNTPMGRPGEVDDFDGALLFLATAASGYYTGQVLVVDGGWTAR
jgi:NAD(P)-dependent dehydrogenase (short-subunit alcohol dehydrogenase family)